MNAQSHRKDIRLSPAYMFKAFSYTLVLVLLFQGCGKTESRSDAYGNFESDEIIIAPEVQGRIVSFDRNEGDLLSADALIAELDSSALVLKKEQLQAGLVSVTARLNALQAQTDVLKVQMNNAEREFARIGRLLQDGAVSRKQFDDMEGQIQQLKAQIRAQEVQKETILAERLNLQVQIRQLDDQLNRTKIRAPGKVTMLAKYKEKGEIAVPGQALCKVADLDELYLRAYISGRQLPSVKLGATVTVLYDSNDSLLTLPGTVTWISSQAEFTPKTIQTREERVDLVYAVRVRVKNDGSLKIGMPGEFKLN